VMPFARYVYDSHHASNRSAGYDRWMRWPASR